MIGQRWDYISFNLTPPPFFNLPHHVHPLAHGSQLSLLTIHSLLEPGGDLHDEWSTLHDFHLNPSSIAVSTSCTPRSIISRSTANNVASKENPGLGQQLQHQTSGITSQPLSSPFNEEGDGMRFLWVWPSCQVARIPVWV